jgi:AraC-like DNA-binding protein
MARTVLPRKGAKSTLAKKSEMSMMKSGLRRSGLSLPYLSRIFKKEHGMGLLDYISKYRVEKAKAFMQSGGEDTIATIATKVGFNSSQTLIRVFKRYEEITPGQYKANQKERGSCPHGK